MSISVNWRNPYEDCPGRWYKGNLHTHTWPASHCGKLPLERMLAEYARLGYDFLSISDHMTLTAARHDSLTIIPGLEWNAPNGVYHTGLYSLDEALLAEAPAFTDQQSLLTHMAGRDAMVVMNHPNWLPDPHYRREKLDERTGYDAIEIYNHVIERLEGYAISTDKWDYLLSRGRRVLGLASDDSHIEQDIGGAALMVRSASGDAASLLAAIRRGRFYCTSGVWIRRIGRQGNTVSVESENAQEIQAIGDGGARLERHAGPSLEFDLGPAKSYVRFALYGPGSSMAWTQPFFLG